MRGGVAFGPEHCALLWDKYSTAAPAQLRQYGALSSVVRKAYRAVHPDAPELLPSDATGRLDVKQALDQLFFKNGERFFKEW